MSHQCCWCGSDNCSNWECRGFPTLFRTITSVGRLKLKHPLSLTIEQRSDYWFCESEQLSGNKNIIIAYKPAKGCTIETLVREFKSQVKHHYKHYKKLTDDEMTEDCKQAKEYLLNLFEE